MPTFGAHGLRQAACTLNAKVSAAPTVKLHMPDAVGAEQHTSSAARAAASESLLFGAPGLADLGKARREYDRRADAAPPACRDRLDHGVLGNDQHGGIDAVRQVVDARHARRGR